MVVRTQITEIVKAKELGYNVDYVKDFTETAEKYLSFISRNNEQINITYGKDLNSSSYMFFAKKNGTNDYMNPDLESVLNYIQNHI